jgi:hypothetical protein
MNTPKYAFVIILAVNSYALAMQCKAQALLRELPSRDSNLQHVNPNTPVVALKSKCGIVIIWNKSAPFFRMEVCGKEVSSFGDKEVVFRVDGIAFEVLTTPIKPFWNNKISGSPIQILQEHRIWESAYLNEFTGQKLVIKERITKANNGDDILIWEALPFSKPLPEGSSRIYMTRYRNGGVIALSSTISSPDEKNRTEQLLLDAISNLEIYSQKLNIADEQQKLRTQK